MLRTTWCWKTGKDLSSWSSKSTAFRSINFSAVWKFVYSTKGVCICNVIQNHSCERIEQPNDAKAIFQPELKSNSLILVHIGLFSINQMGGLASCFIDLYTLAWTPSLLIMPMTCQKVRQPQGLSWDAGSNTYVNVHSEAAPRPCMTSPSAPTLWEHFNCWLLKSQRHNNFTYLCLRHVKRQRRWP